MGKIRLLIVDRMLLFREGLARLLGDEPGIEVVGTSSDVTNVMEKLSELRPDVILIDMEPDTHMFIEAIHRISEQRPETKVCVLTYSTDSDSLFHAIRSGALGYVTKDVPLEQLVQALTIVAQGDVTIRAPLAFRLLQEFVLSREYDSQCKKQIDILTERELEVLKLVAEGLTNKEIADNLFITENTVKVHLKNTMKKLHLRNRQQVAALAVEGGLTHHIQAVS